MSQADFENVIPVFEASKQVRAINRAVTQSRLHMKHGEIN